MNFTEKVQNIVKGIPTGKTMSYSQVAAVAGASGAARAVGTIMANNHDDSIPCHRVIRADGTPGQYNRSGGEEAKRKKLRSEGVEI